MLAANEQCEPAPHSSCTPICTVPRCGDGFVTPTLGEECDDGNMEAGDGCSMICRIER
ncbi:MAG: DUF4215 domain-containing protein [Labilithrix sp.]|nr:DUF4215 domain-containing protein [Labilithrix sp.]MBX3220527.1 DUF4215 domain-containing protein [Labilithrix sp.]